jgi:hypothetical protein
MNLKETASNRLHYVYKPARTPSRTPIWQHPSCGHVCSSPEQPRCACRFPGCKAPEGQPWLELFTRAWE